MRRQAVLFVCALQFLTRLPTPGLAVFDPDWLTRSARYFPLAGQVVGALAALVLLGAAQVWPMPVAVILALAVGVLLTGALHEDGLADSADGLFGGTTPARRLEIMKDSRIGVFGVVALILALGLKAAALVDLPPWLAAAVLVGAYGFGRAMAVVAMRITPYAPEGRPTRWTPSAQGVTNGELAIALAIAAWPLLLLPPIAGLAAVVGGGLLAVGGLRLAHRRLGGHTGDILGGVEQLGELGFLLGAAAVLA